MAVLQIDQSQRVPGEQMETQVHSRTYQREIVRQHSLAEQGYLAGRSWHNTFRLAEVAFHNAGRAEPMYCHRVDRSRTYRNPPKDL